MLVLILALSGLLLVHAFIGYGLSLRFVLPLVARVREQGGHPNQGAPVLPPSELPRVTMVVAAHNEAACIGDKLRNFQSLDYPREKLDLIVGSDGSNDETDAIVARFARDDPRVRLSSAPRAGKSAVLNRCVPQARGEWVLLTDANTMLRPDALRAIARHTQRLDVGAIAGRLVLMRPGTSTGGADGFGEPATEGEGLYWRHETWLKSTEARFGVLLGMNGALYALRRDLFTPLHPETIVDDLVIPLRLVIAGHALASAPDALAFEETAASLADESRRRVRIAAGNFQSLAWLWPLLSPRRGLWAYAFWSHKVLRWCAPLLLALAFVANAALATQGRLWSALFALQCLFYGVALVGALVAEPVAETPLPRHTTWTRLLVLPRAIHFFVRMNWAQACGFVRFVLGRQRATWERTARSFVTAGNAAETNARDRE